MLVISRCIGETIMIGDEVTVTVLAVKGQQVRIGINAPKDIAVDRPEIRALKGADSRKCPEGADCNGN